MKNRTLRLFSLLLTLILLLGCLPAPALAAQDILASGECGETAAWELFRDGTLTISGTGRMNAYLDNDPDGFSNVAPWGSYADRITAVTVSEGITYLGGSAFAKCAQLAQVSLPQSLTEIGSGAFMYCTGLRAIEIPNGVERINTDAFLSCTALEEITLPDSLAYLGIRAFWGCTSLRSIQLPRNLTKLGDNAFGNCLNLQTIHLPANVTNLGFTAFGASGLTAIEVPRGVTSICGTFASCEALTTVTLPETVTTLDAFAFDGCTSLPAITIPESVETIGEYAFRNCQNLTEVTFTGDAPTIRSSAFVNTTLTAYYPADKNWPAEALQNYGGTITWVPYGTPALPELTGTWNADFVFPAADLGVQANDIVFRCTLTFTEDGAATADWTPIDLSALREYFHDMFVNAYYACAYGAGFTTFEAIEEFCQNSTGMNVSAYMYSFLDGFNMYTLFKPASASGIYSYTPDHTAFFTTLPLMSRPSDATVPNPFTQSDSRLTFQANSYGLPEQTITCARITTP